jgi:predicted Zn-dependent peptidase
MYEDDPQEKVFDVLGEATFGTDPLGRAIIGRAEVISETPAAAIAAFHAERYQAGNIVIAAAGAVDHDAFVAMAQSQLEDLSSHRSVRYLDTAASAPPAAHFERKDTEQYHVCLGATGIARHDERRFALKVLDTIFGGTSSSRLFQEVREQRGLAYSVYSFTSGYRDTGQIGLYVGTRGENLAPAMAVVGTELRRLRDAPASAEELRRAKENLKGRVVLALESTGARMNRLGSEILADEPLLTLDEVTARIDAVTLEDLAELTDELWAPERICAAGIGPDRERFDAALAEAVPELTAAAATGG